MMDGPLTAPSGEQSRNQSGSSWLRKPVAVETLKSVPMSQLCHKEIFLLGRDTYLFWGRPLRVLSCIHHRSWFLMCCHLLICQVRQINLKETISTLMYVWTVIPDTFLKHLCPLFCKVQHIDISKLTRFFPCNPVLSCQTMDKCIHSTVYTVPVHPAVLMGINCNMVEYFPEKSRRFQLNMSARD